MATAVKACTLLFTVLLTVSLFLFIARGSPYKIFHEPGTDIDRPIWKEFVLTQDLEDAKKDLSAAAWTLNDRGQRREVGKNIREEITAPETLLLRVQGTGVWGGVTMTHQLHCLQMINEHIRELEDKTGANASFSAEKHESLHWRHCLNYLAQGIVCQADDTLEPLFEKKRKGGKLEKVVDGSGTFHECRNSWGIRRALQDSRERPVKPFVFHEGDRLRDVLFV